MSWIAEHPSPEVVWDIGRDAPALAEQVRTHARWALDAVARHGETVPVATTYRAFPTGVASRMLGWLPAAVTEGSRGTASLKCLADFEDPVHLGAGGSWIRPRGEHRAFYRRSDDEGVLAYAGADFLAADRDEGLDGLARYPAPEALATHYARLQNDIVLRDRPPLALTVDSALRAAAAGAGFQQAHAERFGAFAAGPVPLRVLRWPEGAYEDALAALATRLRPFELQAARELAAGGLALAIAYHPRLPLRMGRVIFQSRIGPYTAHGYAQRTEVLRRLGVSPQQTLGAWAELVARMLALGWLPCTSADVLDQSISSQNLCLHGGITHTRSLQRIEDVPTELALAETLMITVLELANALRDLMMRPLDNLEKITFTFAELYLGAEMSLATSCVWTALREAVRREEGAVDPRVFAFFVAPFDLAALSVLLHRLFPEVRGDSRQAMNEVWGG